MNRNERTVKEPATFITERCFWGAGGRVVTVTQRVKIVTVEFAFDLDSGWGLGKADRLLVMASSRGISFKNTLVPGSVVFCACKVAKTVKVKVKVKFTLEQATKAQRWSRGISLFFLYMGVGGQRHSPAALPPGKTRHPLYRTLGGPQCQSGLMRKISPPPGFDPRTVQPVTSRYTDWAIPAPCVR
jgi:hypothetical protein